MGFRAGIKAGGGFWNNVDVLVKGSRFTTIAPNASDEGESLFWVPVVRVDGQDKDTDRHFYVGKAEWFDVAEDGQSVTGVGKGVTTFGAMMPFGKFVTSLLDKGFPEDELPDLEAGEPLSMAGLNGYRIRLIQEVDDAGNAKLGNRKDSTGKKEEGYPRTNTVVAQVYGRNGLAANPKAAVNGNVKATKVSDTALRDAADNAVVAIIEANTDKKNPAGETAVSKLSVGVIRLAKGSSEHKEAIRKLVKSDGYLAGASERGVFTYDDVNEAVSIS